MQLLKPMLLIVAVVVLSGNSGCRREETRPGAADGHDAVILAVSPQPVSAPVYVAYEKGFFTEEGLQVGLQSCNSGRDALNAVIEGQAHFGTVSDTPIMIAGLKGEKIYVLATVAESDKYMKIITRKDRGISIPADLKGKKIGVSSGTSGEFFLHVFLTLNHLAPQDVQAVTIRPEDMVDALATGEVDAVSTWVPYATILQKKLGDNALIIFDSGVYDMTWNITATQDFVNRHPEQVKKFLRAILRAEGHIKEHPEEARAITAGHILMDRSILDEIWNLYEFNTLLDQSLILNLEDQARWRMRQQNSTQKTPNFMDFIYTDGLKAVRPDVVGIAGK